MTYDVEVLMAPINESPAGAELRSLRAAAGLSQQQVAEQAKCSVTSVAQLERGLRPNRSEVTRRIVAVLDSVNDNGSAVNAAAVKNPRDRRGRDAA
jgi:transcriptional regulator with XRE-family HTH domain